MLLWCDNFVSKNLAKGVKLNILIVEDDLLSSKQLAQLLTKEKYTCDLAGGYLEAKEYIDKNKYALILLDWNLGDGDGLTLLKEIRDLDIDCAILMISGNVEVYERVIVLDAGADDYLCKPYSNIELLARMRVLLRQGSKEKSSVLFWDDIQLNIVTHEVFAAKELINLTLAEFDLLELFMKNQNMVLSRFQLSEHINKDNYAVKHSNILDVHIKNLRKKLARKDVILNIRGVGYKMNKSS